MKKVFQLQIGKNAHDNILGYHGNLDAINALAYPCEGIKIEFEVGRGGRLKNVKAEPITKSIFNKIFG